MVASIVGSKTAQNSGSSDLVIPISDIDIGSWMVVAAMNATQSTISLTMSSLGWTPLATKTVMGSRAAYVWGKIKELDDLNITIAKSASDYGSAVLLYGEGADEDLDNWIIGDFGVRGGSGGTGTTSVAPEISTLDPDSLAIAFLFEATNSTESQPSFSGTGWTHHTWLGQGGGSGVNIETIDTAYKFMSSPGNTGNVTTTYSNTQASNGGGIQIGIPSQEGDTPPPDPEEEIPISAFGGTLIFGEAFEGTRLEGLAFEGVLLKRWLYTVTDMMLEDEIRVAWRGLGDLKSEMTMDAYDYAVSLGMKILEVSVNFSSDGVPIMIHDSTTNSATATSYTVASETASTLLGIPVDKPVSGGSLGRLEDLLDAYAETHVIFIDDKTNSHSSDILELLENYPNPTKHFVFKGFRGWSPAANIWRSEGYLAWGIYYDDEIGSPGSPHSSVSSYDILGLNYDADETDWGVALATGKRVLGHVIHNSSDRTEALSNGATGIMTGVFF